MKKSQLKQAIREALELKEYSTYAQDGKTKGRTTNDFRNILTKIAEGPTKGDLPQKSQNIKEDPDKVRAAHLGTVRANLMHVLVLLNMERPYQEITSYVKQALKQVQSSDSLSSTGTMAEGEDEQTYIVHYRVGEDDDDDVEVKASSAAQAIEKAKAGKTAGGQNMPRLARSFSARLK